PAPMLILSVSGTSEFFTWRPVQKTTSGATTFLDYQYWLGAENVNETVNHQHRRIWILLAAAAAAVVLLAVAWVGAANAQGSSSNFESGQSILSSLASESSNATMLPGFVAESGMGSQVAETAKYLISSEVATY